MQRSLRSANAPLPDDSLSAGALEAGRITMQRLKDEEIENDVIGRGFITDGGVVPGSPKMISNTLSDGRRPRRRSADARRP